MTKQTHKNSSNCNEGGGMEQINRYTTHLPRGYFKKRKRDITNAVARPPDGDDDDDDTNCFTSDHSRNAPCNGWTCVDVRPLVVKRIRMITTLMIPYQKLVCNCSYKRHVQATLLRNFVYILACYLLLTTTMLTKSVNADFTTEASSSLLTSIRSNIETTTPSGEQIPTTDGICSNIDVRFDIKELEALRGCRVVEGAVRILLIDEVTAEEFSNYTFPELVEITDYLMLYRISGVRSLSDLFPNLAVIRGRTLFKDYSLIIYEMMNLEEIALLRLQSIERGSVRIEKNDMLCFADRIDWTEIAIKSLTGGVDENYISKNKFSAYCPVCPSEKDKTSNSTVNVSCPASKHEPKRNLCWNQNHCQQICPCPNGVQCTKDGKCCDKNCLGGCDENNTTRCIACKQLSIGHYPDMKCVDACPDNMFKLSDRRCITLEECRAMNDKESEREEVDRTGQELNTGTTFIPFDGHCRKGCPSSYVERKNSSGIFCEPCGMACQKRCKVKLIDSISAAQSLKGCQIIEGPLEIQIRSSGKTADPSSNIVKELVNSLSEIEVIEDYLKIARSFPIVSLSFLKKLKVIKGNHLESNRYSLFIWDNQNLQELWDESQKITIEKGKLFFHFNPKLCFFKIERLQTKQIVIDNYETAKLSNGDKTPCNVTSLNVSVVNIYSKAALVQWQPLILDDERSLLSYVVFYIPAPFQNVTLWDGRDACGNDGWHVDDVNDFSHFDTISFPLTRLEPYTQYAYYVKAYTLATEKTGAQSEISYFRTWPGRPEAVTKFKAQPNSSSEIIVTWDRPKKINGELVHYILKARMIDQTETVNQRDYCQHALNEDPLPSPRIVESPQTAPETNMNTLLSKQHTICDCNTCSQTCQPHVTDGEERQSSIDFEDEIQNFVYIRAPEISETVDNKEPTRAKRDINPELFPENGKIDGDDKKEKEKEMKTTLNYFNEYIEIVETIEPNATSFKLRDLQHYSSYMITVKACRATIDAPVDPENEEQPCGPEMQVTSRTFKKEDADLIKMFEVEKVTNGSLGAIKLTWQQPERPNGLIVAYTITFQRHDIDNHKAESYCIPHKGSHNISTHYYKLEGLSTGNYSIRIAAHSLAGIAKFTEPKYVHITENSNYNYYWAMSIGLFLIFFCIFMTFFIWCKRVYLPSMTSMKLIANVNPDYAGVSYKQDDWEVPRENIIQLHELGQGSFGMVYEGIIKHLKMSGDEIRCAIKTVNENATDKERISFLNEASVMKQFDTHHVVHLLGVVSKGQPTLVIMELMANGDLKGYLRSHRPEFENGNEPPPQPPTLRRIFQMAIEIADGMAYLTAKKFVHRDLAARNCMVAEDLTVKIGDFGMTRDIYETDYYRKGTKGLLPVRWMSPESLKDGVFATSSDVFSYGVVLWEMTTLASQPYQGLSNDQVLRYVIDGGVMERPENCPDKLYELMRRCWQHRPSARPSFMEIITLLLDEVSPNFANVSYYHTPEGQEIYRLMVHGDLALQINDDVTTPLRNDEETSSIDGHFLMGEMDRNHRLDDDDV